MEKNNIIWLHSHFLYWMGGTKFVYQILKHMRMEKKDLQITVIVENTSEFAKQQYKNENIELISLNSKSSNNYFYWLFFLYFSFKHILKIKKKLRNKGLNKDNSIIFSGMFPMNFFATFINIEHIQNCYEPFAFFYDNNFIKQFSLIKVMFIKIITFLYSPLDKWAIKKSKKVLTLNNTTRKAIKNIYQVDSIKTQAGVNSNLFKPYVSNKLKNKYKEKVIAIHSTDYSPIKGTDLVIKAFARASKNIKNSVLLITTTIENKNKENDLIKLAKNLNIKNKIKFLGFVPIKELPQYYSLAKVMIQGSFSKKSGTTSMSLPVKEALCCGTPAIRPNMGGEDVINKISGFLVDPRNTREMSQKIKFLLLNSKISKKMGLNGRKYIVNKYTWENTAKVFLNQLN